jgi:hypothetical protein
MLRGAGDHPATQGGEGLAAAEAEADKQRGLARIEELAGSSAPNACIAAKEALAARNMAGMDDDVRPPPAPAPDALRALLGRADPRTGLGANVAIPEAGYDPKRPRAGAQCAWNCRRRGSGIPIWLVSSMARAKIACNLS